MLSTVVALDLRPPRAPRPFHNAPRFFQVIKARIHGLIEREYLERDTNQANHYSYLA